MLAWVWAVGRSGGLLRLLAVGCVRRMSSGPVVVGGVARVVVPAGCVLVGVVVSWVVGVIDTPPHPLPPSYFRCGGWALLLGVRAGRALMGSILPRASVG